MSGTGPALQASPGRRLCAVHPTVARELVLTLGLVLAGCGGASSTPGPTLVPSVGATTAPEPTPEPTVVPTVDPCADATALTASLELHGTENLLALELEPGDPGPAATISPTVIEATETALGGETAVELRLDLDGAEAAGAALLDLSADFVPFEATAAEPVGATVDGTTARLQLPGRNVSGVLRVAATWRSECGEASGGGKLGLQLLDPSVAAGCPSTSEGLQRRVEDLQATTLRVGGPAGVHIPIGIVGWSGRWTDAAAIDEVPQFAGWDTAIGVTVPAGATMNVKEVLDGTDYTLLRFAFYERADVEAWLEGSLGEISSVDVVRKNPSATGGVEVPLDFAPGQYVVEIQGTWQTPCLELDSYAVLSVQRQ